MQSQRRLSLRVVPAQGIPAAAIERVDLRRRRIRDRGPAERCVGPPISQTPSYLRCVMSSTSFASRSTVGPQEDEQIAALADPSWNSGTGGRRRECRRRRARGVDLGDVVLDQAAEDDRLAVVGEDRRLDVALVGHDVGEAGVAHHGLIEHRGDLLLHLRTHGVAVVDVRRHLQRDADVLALDRREGVVRAVVVRREGTGPERDVLADDDRRLGVVEGEDARRRQQVRVAVRLQRLDDRRRRRRRSTAWRRRRSGGRAAGRGEQIAGADVVGVGLPSPSPSRSELRRAGAERALEGRARDERYGVAAARRRPRSRRRGPGRRRAIATSTMAASMSTCVRRTSS